MKKEYKYDYWTLIKKLKINKKGVKIGELISFKDKREYFTIMNIRTGEITLEGNGIYVGRTPNDWKTKQKIKFLNEIIKKKGLEKQEAKND